MDLADFFAADQAPWWWSGFLGLLGALVGGLIGFIGTKASDNRKFTAEEKRLAEQVKAVRRDAWRGLLLDSVSEFVGACEQLRQKFVGIHHAAVGATEADMEAISSILLAVNTKSAEIRLLSQGPLYDAAQTSVELLREMIASEDIQRDFGELNRLLVKSLVRISDVGRTELGYDVL